MAEGERLSTSWLSWVVPAILSGVIAIGGSTWATQSQLQSERQTRALDNASDVLSETTSLLLDEYQRLEGLLNYSDDAEKVSDVPEGFYDAHERWRQKLLIQRFAIRRYYSDDLADSLVDLDSYLDDDCAVDGKCENSGETGEAPSFLEASRTIVRDAAALRLYNQMMEEDKENSFDIFLDKREAEDHAWKNLRIFERNIIAIISMAEHRLSAAGKPEYTFITRPGHHSGNEDGE